MRLSMIAGVALALATAAPALAHDSFIVPVAPTRGPMTLQVTSSGFFPEPESAIRPARIERLVIALGGLDWPMAPAIDTLTAGEVALAIPVNLPPIIDAHQSELVAAVDLGAWDIDVGADEVAHYMDEIGASADLRAAVSAAVARDGVLRETYTKHLKTLTCVGPCRGDTHARPVGSRLEMAVEGRTVVLTLDGAPVAAQPVFLNTEGGGRRALVTDADGRLALPADIVGPVFLGAVILSPPASADARFTSEWASLTFDASILTP